MYIKQAIGDINAVITEIVDVYKTPNRENDVQTLRNAVKILEFEIKESDRTIEKILKENEETPTIFLLKGINTLRKNFEKKFNKKSPELGIDDFKKMLGGD